MQVIKTLLLVQSNVWLREKVIAMASLLKTESACLEMYKAHSYQVDVLKT